MNLEQIQELFSNAVQDDMERGAAWLNEAAAEKFGKEYPKISAAISRVMNLDAEAESQEPVHTMVELKRGEAALIISNDGSGMYLQPQGLPAEEMVPSAVISTLATILHPSNEDLLDALRTRYIINLGKERNAH